MYESKMNKHMRSHKLWLKKKDQEFGKSRKKV